MPDYVAANYGGVDLLVSTIETQVGRDVVTQSPFRGDKHVNQDLGLKQKVAQVTVLFCDQPGKADWMLRAKQFLEATESDAPTVFTHPILGTYTARITDVSLIAEAQFSIEFRARILAEDEPQVTFQASAGVSAGAGVESVTVASTNVTNASALASLTAAENSIASAVATASIAIVAGWSAVDAQLLDAQQVFLEVASLTNQIDSAIESLSLEGDLALWPVYQAMILLRFACVRAAEAVTSTALNVFDLVVTQPRPLLAICAEIYGPALAEQRWSDVTQLNRIRTPGLVPSGTTLKMPSDGVL